VDLKQSLLVERHHAESFLRERVVPVVEMHRDRDVVWIVHGGQAGRNAGIMVHQYPVVLSCCGDGGSIALACNLPDLSSELTAFAPCTRMSQYSQDRGSGLNSRT
jgi:hypothetical protein